MMFLHRQLVAVQFAGRESSLAQFASPTTHFELSSSRAEGIVSLHDVHLSQLLTGWPKLNSDNGGHACKDQYSVVPGLHGDEINAWANAPGNKTGNNPHSRDLTTAFAPKYGNFIIDSDPSISNEDN